MASLVLVVLLTVVGSLPSSSAWSQQLSRLGSSELTEKSDWTLVGHVDCSAISSAGSDSCLANGGCTFFSEEEFF